MSELYQYIRQGDESTADLMLNHVVSNDPSEAVGELVKLAYAGTKDGVVGVWEHTLEKKNGRCAYLLHSKRGGNYRSPYVEGELASLGRVIDLVIKLPGSSKPSRVLTPGLWVCSDSEGHVILAAAHDVPISIESRDSGPYITDRGMIG